MLSSQARTPLAVLATVLFLGCSSSATSSPATSDASVVDSSTDAAPNSEAGTTCVGAGGACVVHGQCTGASVDGADKFSCDGAETACCFAPETPCGKAQLYACCDGELRSFPVCTDAVLGTLECDPTQGTRCDAGTPGAP